MEFENSDIRLLVTGGRDYNDRARIAHWLDHLKPKVVIHGDCPTGADRLADEEAKSRGIPVESIPFERGRGRAGGPIRNQRLIEEKKPTVVLALPGGSGTYDMICRAKANRIPVIEDLA